MWLKSVSKEKIIYVAVGIYVAVVLWITLFSREITYSHTALIPFSSYVKIFQGDRIAIIENVENILLFIPLGYVFQMFLNTNWKRAVLLGFAFSFSIEFAQLLSTLGCFEVEDLLHNTTGALLGFTIHRLITYKVSFDRKLFCQYTIRMAMAVIFLLILVSSVKETINRTTHFNEMKKYAEINDSSCSSNYFVFTGDFGQIGGTDVTVSFNSDGSCTLSGTADEDAWKVIASFNLEKGTYVFKDLNNCKNVKMISEKKNIFSGKYSTIGRIGQSFTLKKDTNIIVAIGVIAGYEYTDTTILPVIYKEE